MLIIIGDPTVLSLDPTWGAFLHYIRNHGGWRGKDPEADLDGAIWDEDYTTKVRERADLEAMEMIERVKSLIVDKHVADEWEIPNVDDPELDGEAYMDRTAPDAE